MSSRLQRGDTKPYTDYLSVTNVDRIAWSSTSEYSEGNPNVFLGTDIARTAIGGKETVTVNGLTITYERVRDPITKHVTVKVRYKGGTGPNLVVTEKNIPSIQGFTNVQANFPPGSPPRIDPLTVNRLEIPAGSPASRPLTGPTPPPITPVAESLSYRDIPGTSSPRLGLGGVGVTRELTNWEKNNWLNSLKGHHDKFRVLYKNNRVAFYDKKLLLKTVADKMVYNRYEMPNPRDPVDLPPETLMSGWASMVVMDCMTKFTPDPAAPGNNMSQYGEWVLGLDARLDALALAAKFTKKPDASKSSIHKEVRGWAITDDPTRQSLPFWTRNESGKMYSTLATIRVNERTGGISEVASLLERYYRACYRLLQVPDLFDPQQWQLEQLSEAASKWADAELKGQLYFETLVAWTRRALEERKVAEAS